MSDANEPLAKSMPRARTIPVLWAAGSQPYNRERIDTPAAASSQPARTPLTDLWRRRLDTIISGVQNGYDFYAQEAHAAEHISAEYHGRYLIELIQNANDQAVRQGLSDSLVTIHRTDGLLAVGNSGQPFDDAKVDTITSLFKSDKAADECLGNKGIGFKAVFQIADSAEIYSSHVGSNLAAACAIAFRIVRNPFDEETFACDIRTIARDLLDGNRERKQAIEGRFPSQDPVDVVAQEAARAPWFTFPLPTTATHFRMRATELALSVGDLNKIQTLIVLPIERPESSACDVANAIDEVHGGDGSLIGSSFLFLPGIAGIQIADYVRKFRVEVQKRNVAEKTGLSERGNLRRVIASRTRFDLGSDDHDPPREDQNWWIAERVLGHGSDERAARERASVRQSVAALRLPEENWKGVEQIPVAVALPDADRSDDDECKPLGAHGRFCIGLPTHVSTGLPFWVSAHFHGKIDRTEINFRSAYNELLLTSGAALAEALLERLKEESSKVTRRLVTLALERSEGKLGDIFYAVGGAAHRAVVLDNQGKFVRGVELRLPAPSDVPMFRRLSAGVVDLEDYGFRLPDEMLLVGAREILDGFQESSAVDEGGYLRRPPGRLSLLERAAKTHRHDGADFWQPFLEFVLDRFGFEHRDVLADQVILPTGKSELANARSRVFFRPTRASANSERSEDAQEELASIDDTVASLLRFFDEKALDVRTPATNDYTSLAQRLASDAGGLVRRPRREDLINDAVIPAMREARRDNDRMLALLRQALLWLVAAPSRSKQRVMTRSLFVPCGRGKRWEWIEPESVYLANGWADDASIDLLTQAYGHRPGGQLVAWRRFEKRAVRCFKEVDKSWWTERMKEIGVAEAPRIIHGAKTLVAESRRYDRLTAATWAKCPVPCPDAIWKEYLVEIARREASTRSGQPFYLSEVAWIDGLEDDTNRANVVHAMLRKPERYDRHRTAKLSRWGGEDSTDVCALWVYALRHAPWDVVPTSRGPCAPNRAWYLPMESRAAKADRFAFLSCVAPELSHARALLRDLGVVAIEEADIPRLVSALHALADQVEGASAESLRHLEAIASDLYEAIELRLQSGEPAGQLESVIDSAVPLLRGGTIGAARLDDVSHVLVDDDSVRRRYLSAIDERWILPGRFQNTYDSLVPALRKVHGIGEERLVRASELPIEVEFFVMDECGSVLDPVTTAYPSRAVAEDIALLMLKSARDISTPRDAAFRSAWARLTRARLLRGKFVAGSSLKACYDAHHAGGPALLADSTLRAHEPSALAKSDPPALVRSDPPS